MKLHHESDEERQLRLQHKYGNQPVEDTIEILQYAGMCLDLQDALTAADELSRKSGLLEPVEPVIAELSKGAFARLFNQMREAHLKGLAWPKLNLGTALNLHLSYNAKKDIINMTNGKSYGHPDNVWFGRLEDKATWDECLQYNNRVLIGSVKAELGRVLSAYMNDPAAYALEQSKHTSRCMFCSKELLKKESTTAGYGPTCADKYGLPWGEK